MFAAALDRLTSATRRPKTRPASPVLLGRRRIYILPTGYGLSFAAVLLVMLLGAVNYDNALAYMLCFLLGSIALVSILHTYRNLAGLRVSARPGAPVFATARAHFELHVDNRAQASRPALQVQAADKRGAQPPPRTIHMCVPENDVLPVDLVRMSRSRGWQALGRVRISTTHPLGIFRAWALPELDARVLVYPAPAGNQPLPQSTADPKQHGLLAGRGDEDFFGLREYAPGDSPQRIHWKAAARSDVLPIKQFAGSSPEHLELRWQDVAPSDPEDKLSQLCRWVVDAHKAQRCFGLSVPGKTVVPGSGIDHLERCLAVLALWGTAHD